MRKPPSVLVAFVLAANRSEPEFGSLMPIEKQTSPRQMRGRMSILICSGAYFKSTGPLWRSATKKRRVGALATRIFPAPTYRRKTGRPCPPYFLGQVMPIQPRSPTRLEKPGTSLSWPCGLCGSKVPRATSSARKARTSLRSLSHSGGRRIGSKRSAAVIVDLFPKRLARGDQRPQFVGAARRDALAEFDRPVAFMTKIVAPGQRAHGVAMQDVLERITDRAVNLMGDRGSFFGGLRAADFCGGRFQEHRIVKTRGIGDGIRR